MARLAGNIQFIGSVGNLTAYTRKDSDKIILRTKGGASKEKIKTSDSFVKTRELNTEWAGCTKTGQAIRQSIHPLKVLADYNFSGPLNAMMKTMQKLDEENVQGERSIYLSKYRELLNGFNLNTRTTLDSVIRNPITYAIDR